MSRLKQQSATAPSPPRATAPPTALPAQNAEVLAKHLAAAERRAQSAEALARQVQELLSIAPQGSAKPSTVIRFVDAVGEALKKLEAGGLLLPPAQGSAVMVPAPPVLQPQAYSPQREETGRAQEQQLIAREREVQLMKEREAAREREFAALKARLEGVERELDDAKRSMKGMVTLAESQERTQAFQRKAQEWQRELAQCTTNYEVERAEWAAKLNLLKDAVVKTKETEQAQNRDRAERELRLMKMEKELAALEGKLRVAAVERDKLSLQCEAASKGKETLEAERNLLRERLESIMKKIQSVQGLRIVEPVTAGNSVCMWCRWCTTHGALARSGPRRRG